MIVSMWMTRDVVTIEPSTLVTQVATLMAAKHIRRMPVVQRRSRGERLVGIVAARDVFHAFPPDVNPFSIVGSEVLGTSAKVDQIMTLNPITTSPETPIHAAAAVMRNRKIGGMPVLRSGELVGLITESDVLQAFIDIFEAPQGKVLISFKISKDEDIFPIIAEIAKRRNLRVQSLLTHHEVAQSRCTVCLAGQGADFVVDDLWYSGHRVLSVTKL
jgi:acetoin utilization protein AcuB